MARKSPRTAKDRALDEIYAEMPAIPDCDGSCAEACGPIAMFKGEWDRIKRAKGHTPRPTRALVCPMLSPTGRCTVYTVRPFICRLWGATPGLTCPHGCKPERWLSLEEALSLFKRIEAVAGAEVSGPLGNLADLWAGIGLAEREGRMALVERIKEAVNDGRWDEATRGSRGPASAAVPAEPGVDRAGAAGDDGGRGRGEPAA